MKNIVFTINNIGASGGTQKMCTWLANYLIKSRGFTVKILSNQSKDSYYPLEEEVVVHKITNKGVWSSLLEYRKVINTSRADVVISLDSNTAILPLLFIGLKTKLIIWEHLSLNTNSRRLSIKSLRLLGIIRASKIVLINNFELNLWSTSYAFVKHKFILIHNPLENLPDLNTANLEFRTVLAVGNNAHVKGFDLLVSAWKEIDRSWKLNIIGLSERDIQKLKTINNESNVKYYTRTRDLKEYYSKASIFVLSSRKDNAPMVVRESQSYGIPTLAYNHLRGVVEMVGRAGIVVDINQPKTSLINGINCLRKDIHLYESLSNEAYRSSRKFNENIIGNQWIDILNL